MSSRTRHYGHWYLLSLRGVFLLFLGIYAIQLPVGPIIEFARIFELFTVFSGILLIQHALLNRQYANWQFILFNGLLDLSFGIILWLIPQINMNDLKLVLAIWFLYSGLIQVVDSFILIHDHVTNWWFELVAGMLSFILAFSLIAVHIRLQIEVFTLVGIFALIYGVFMAVTPFFLREKAEE